MLAGLLTESNLEFSEVRFLNFAFLNELIAWLMVTGSELGGSCITLSYRSVLLGIQSKAQRLKMSNPKKSGESDCITCFGVLMFLFTRRLSRRNASVANSITVDHSH